MSVLIEVGEGGLASKFLRFEVGYEVSNNKYPLYDELGYCCCFQQEVFL